MLCLLPLGLFDDLCIISHCSVCVLVVVIVLLLFVILSVGLEVVVTGSLCSPFPRTKNCHSPLPIIKIM